jgi:hypothetical protein
LEGAAVPYQSDTIANIVNRLAGPFGSAYPPPPSLGRVTGIVGDPGNGPSGPTFSLPRNPRTL